MKQGFVVVCLMCVVKSGVMLSAIDAKVTTKNSEAGKQEKFDDLEGSETSAKLFNLASLFPTYSSYPSYRPGGYYPSSFGGFYPSSMGGFYPSSTGGNYYPTQGYYPNSGYYPSSGYNPSGTNFLGGGGYGGYPTQSYYPNTGYVRTGAYAGYSGYGGYGGYGGNGGLKAYYGYENPQYSGKRNLGFGYYSDTDRYGFYRSPSRQYSVNRGYN